MAALGIPLSSQAAAYAGSPPTSAADAIALALSQVGKTLAQVQATAMLEEPWHSYQGDWCANFVSWILRASGKGRLTWVDEMPQLGSPVSTPAIGDIFVYPWYHTGMVAGLNPITIVAGNEPGSLHWSATPVVTRTLGGASTLYYRPNYTGASTGDAEQEGTDMTDLIYYADSALGPRYASGTNVVELESMWYQECVGAPLYPLTAGLAYNATAAFYEYGAFMSTRSAVQAKRYAMSAAQIGALIALRGKTTKPTGNF